LRQRERGHLISGLISVLYKCRFTSKVVRLKKLAKN
jgi:hypothetical protein